MFRMHSCECITWKWKYCFLLITKWKKSNEKLSKTCALPAQTMSDIGRKWRPMRASSFFFLVCNDFLDKQNVILHTFRRLRKPIKENCLPSPDRNIEIERSPFKAPKGMHMYVRLTVSSAPQSFGVCKHCNITPIGSEQWAWQFGPPAGLTLTTIALLVNRARSSTVLPVALFDTRQCVLLYTQTAHFSLEWTTRHFGAVHQRCDPQSGGVSSNQLCQHTPSSLSLHTLRIKKKDSNKDYFALLSRNNGHFNL